MMLRDLAIGRDRSNDVLDAVEDGEVVPDACIIESLDGNGTRLVVSGGWSEGAVACMARHDFDRLEFHGGEYEDFRFLRPWAAKIASLAIPSGAWKSARGLEELTSLRALRLGPPLKGVDFASLASLQTLGLESWTPAYAKTLFECTRLEWLHIEGFAEPDCEHIGRLGTLEGLSLVRGKLASLGGLAGCTKLRALQLAHLRKLSDIATIGDMASIREIELVESLPLIHDIGAVQARADLRRLDLRGFAGRHDGIAWLRDMVRLHVLGLSNVVPLDWDALFASRELKKIAVTFTRPLRATMDDVRSAATERGLRPTSVQPMGAPARPRGFVVEFRPEGSTQNLWFWKDPSDGEVPVH
jgi:hypothetical protein